MRKPVMDPGEMKSNAESLVQHIVEGAPPQLGVAVIFWDKAGGGAMSACNVKAKELAPVLRSVLVTCEGSKDNLTLVKPT